MSLQIKHGEEFVGRRKKALGKAQSAAVEAEAALKTAQAKLDEARAEITRCIERVREAEEGHQILLRRSITCVASDERSTASGGPLAPDPVDALSVAIGNDPEARAALEVLRARLAAQFQAAPSTGVDLPAVPFGPSTGSINAEEKMFAARGAARNTPYMRT